MMSMTPSQASPQLQDSVGYPNDSSAPKSSLRLKYEAEVSVLRRKLGGLEEIRGRLGLSSRKMAQLLMVDPSAWTRWVQGGDSAPPHVWRALAWYLALEEKFPGLDHQFWLSSVARPHAKDLGEVASKRLQMEVKSVREQFQAQLASFQADQLRLQNMERRRQAQRTIWMTLSGVGLFLAGFLLAHSMG